MVEQLSENDFFSQEYNRGTQLQFGEGTLTVHHPTIERMLTDDFQEVEIPAIHVFRIGGEVHPHVFLGFLALTSPRSLAEIQEALLLKLDTEEFSESERDLVVHTLTSIQNHLLEGGTQ